MNAIEMVAKPGCCEEASTLSHAFYIPCNKPATSIIQARGTTGSLGEELRMCDACADHSVRNRGMMLVRKFESKPVDQFDAWRIALETGKPVAYERGQPTSGYFKRRARNADRSIRYDAVAIWQSEDGEWLCTATGGYVPTKADEIEELFVGCNSTPISYDLFEHISNGGAWPDEAAKIETRSDLPPHEAAAAELKAQQDAIKAWLKELGHKPQTKDEADKAVNFSDAFAKIEKSADKQRENEKAPHLEAGRLVDEKWQPTVKGAKEAKAWAKKLSDDFAIAETARRKEEARIANEKMQAQHAAAVEAAKLENERNAELRSLGVRMPEAAPIPEAPKAIVAEAVKLGTGARRQSLRKFTNYEITDATALLTFLATRNSKSEELLAAALKEAKACIVAGIEVPGVRSFEEEKLV